MKYEPFEVQDLFRYYKAEGVKKMVLMVCIFGL